MRLRSFGGVSPWLIGALILLSAAPVVFDRLAARQTHDLKQRLKVARIDGTALRQAVSFHDECLSLQRRYRWTSSRSELAEIEETLRRCVAVETSGDGVAEYFLVKARIETRWLAAGDYAQALREWRQCAELSTDPLFAAHIEGEKRRVDRLSSEAAQKLALEVESSADGRERIEGALPRFLGTEGLQVLHTALKLPP